MNEITYPETTKHVIIQQAKEGLDEFIHFVVEPQHQFSSGSPVVGVFESEEEAKATFPTAFPDTSNTDEVENFILNP
jgi:hypothetical protein